MVNKFSIKIDEKITEQRMMEWCLNLKGSGYDSTFQFCLYAFLKSWHFSKLTYYRKLLEDVKV